MAKDKLQAFIAQRRRLEKIEARWHRLNLVLGMSFIILLVACLLLAFVPFSVLLQGIAGSSFLDTVKGYRVFITH